MALDVCLFMDPELEREVRGLWRILADAGISSPLLDGTGRPHLSLALLDRGGSREAPPGLRRWLERSAERLGSLPVRFSTLGSFGASSGTVFLGPVPTPALLEAHGTLCREMEGILPPVDPLYAPGTWVPHASLTLGASEEHLARALAICLESARLPMEGFLSELGLIAFTRERVLSVESLPLRIRPGGFPPRS